MTKDCRQVISDRQTHAFILPTKNVKPWKDRQARFIEHHKLLKIFKQLRKALCKNWSGYHRQSFVDTKMQCIKLLADKLTARRFPHQANEIHAR